MSEKEYTHIKIEKNKEFSYATISINRPNKLNALAEKTLSEITEALEEFEFDKSVRCVVLRGTKEFTKKPAFSSGADLSSINIPPSVKSKNLMDQSRLQIFRHSCYTKIEKFHKPIIAAVDGFALGGGFELALVCDIIIASKRSIFGFPEVKRGLFPTNGGTQRLVRNGIGKVRAKTMMFFGDNYDAQTMYDWGVISAVVDDEKFEDVVHEKASFLGTGPTKCLFVIKKAIDYGSQVPIDLGIEFEHLGFAIHSQSKDLKEGIYAFIEKRKPNFTGK